MLSHGMGGGAEGFMAETIFFVEQGYQVFSFDITFEKKARKNVADMI